MNGTPQTHPALDAPRRGRGARAAEPDAPRAGPGGILVAALMVTVIACTTRYADPVAQHEWIGQVASDTYAYLDMAKAAPGLVHWSEGHSLAQRVAIPYVVGIGAHLVGIGEYAMFRLFSVAVAFLLAWSLYRALRRDGIGTSTAIVCTTVVVANPWVFRFYLAYAPNLPGLVFGLGTLFVIAGILRQNAAALAAGLLLASLGRQTALLLVPGLLVYVWQHRGSLGGRVTLWAAIVFLPAAVYAITGALAVRMAGPSDNAVQITGLLDWCARSFAWGVLARFLAWAALAFVISAVLWASVASRRRPSPADSDDLPLCVMSACLIAQPLLAGPEVVSYSVVRLVSFALIPMAFLLARRIEAAQIFESRGRNWRSVASVAAIAASSMHHQMSLIGEWSERRLPVFAALLTVASVTLGLVLVGRAQSGEDRATHG